MAMHKKVARLAMLVAVALVLGFVERLIPMPVPVPGIKLGLANMVTLVALYWFGWKDAMLVSVLRVALGGFLFGSGFSIVYATCGAIAAMSAMIGAKKSGLGTVAVSAVGGTVHNLAQLLVAMAVVKTIGLLVYAPVLIISGVMTGALTGTVARALTTRLPCP